MAEVLLFMAPIPQSGLGPTTTTRPNCLDAQKADGLGGLYKVPDFLLA